MMTKSKWPYVSWLLILPSFLVVSSHNLILHPVGHGDEKLVVFDIEDGRTFCYPNLEEMQPSVERMPMRQRDHGLDPLYELTQLKDNARVICHEVGGYTHLERVYPLPAPRDLPDTNKRVQWMAECLGYEPLLSHCFTFNISHEDSHCDNLLGIECGYCSRKIKLEIGESEILTNPEYPHYTDDIVCKWTIETPAPSSIRVTFNDFELPPLNEKGNCHRGFLDIKEVRADANGKTFINDLSSLCGSALPDAVLIYGNGAIISFSSGLYYPRPVGEEAGFNLTVTAIEAIPERTVIQLDYRDILAIVFGAVTIVCIVFVCFVIRRCTKGRQISFQRRLMQERLATQRQEQHDAAVTAMLAVGLHSMGAGPNQPLSSIKHNTVKDKVNNSNKDQNNDATRKDQATRSTNIQSPNAYTSSHDYPPPCAPAPLPPRSIVVPPPPPPPPQLLEPVTAVSLSSKFGSDKYEEHIYMEPSQFEKSCSYINLDDIKCDNTSPISNPRKVSKSHQNIASNCINIWPSTSSLTPSNKTVPLTPDKKNSLKLNFTLNRWNNNSCGGGSLSSGSGSVSPFPGTERTSLNLRHMSSISHCSTLVHCDSIHPSNITLSDSSNTLFHPRCMSQGECHHLSAWAATTYGRTEPGVVSFSSSESVFTSGESISQDHAGDRNRISDGEKCFTLEERPRLTSANSQPQGHLSKSCGDVSPATTLPQRNAVLSSLHQSAPTLPGDQYGSRFVRPVLRRVSQMFLGSISLYTPGSETKKTDNSNIFESCSQLSQDAKNLEKKQDWKGIGSRRLSGKQTNEVALRKDTVSVPTSPRRPPASSVSSSSFLQYKYNRLEKINNADLDALIPRSTSPELSDESNSPDKNHKML